MSYEIVNVTPDTSEWLEERRRSVGASEVAAVMGLSKWATPLDIYKSKHGVDRPFDPQMAFWGHAAEPNLHKWVEQFGVPGVKLEQGFMARRPDFPILHASFDRVSRDPFLTWQMKTAHEFSSHHWDEGIPTEYRVQVQAEMHVAGTSRSAVVVLIGARDARVYWENRDDRFINEQMIPALEVFWHRVITHDPPDPSTLAELNEVELHPGEEIEASETAVEMIERRAVLESDIASMREEADALKLALGNYMGSAEALTLEGRKILTFKYQKGRASFDAAALKRDHPHLVNDYTNVGAPFRVMRTIKPKEKK